MIRLISKQSVFSLTGHNENGSTIVIAILILTVLTLLGISAIDTTTTELKIAGNENLYKQNFNMAEAAIQEALQILKETPLSQRGSLPWVTILENNLEFFSLKTLSGPTWNSTNSSPSSYLGQYSSNPLPNYKPRLNYTPPEFAVSMVTTGSLDLSKNPLYEYTILGKSEFGNGQVLLATGFRQRQ